LMPNWRYFHRHQNSKINYKWRSQRRDRIRDSIGDSVAIL
jgi:hypothetical protein